MNINFNRNHMLRVFVTGQQLATHFNDVLLQGYSSGNPKARLRGNWGHIGELGLLVLVGMTAYSLLMSPAPLLSKLS